MSHLTGHSLNWPNRNLIIRVEFQLTGQKATEWLVKWARSAQRFEISLLGQIFTLTDHYLTGLFTLTGRPVKRETTVAGRTLAVGIGAALRQAGKITVRLVCVFRRFSEKIDLRRAFSKCFNFFTINRSGRSFFQSSVDFHGGHDGA